MAYSQEDLDALKAAIASGVRTVTSGDTTTTYQNLDQMLKVAALMEQEIAAAAASKTTYRRTVAGFSKGF